jgi:hypothetical protein
MPEQTISTPVTSGVTLSPGTYETLSITAAGVITTTAGYAVTAKSAPATIANYGLINAGFYGIGLQAGGTVTNFGTILADSANQYDVKAKNAPATVINEGLISGNGGILLFDGGAFFNDAGATVDSYEGVNGFGGPGFYVNNAGTMSGRYPIHEQGSYATIINSGLVENASHGVQLNGDNSTFINTGTVNGGLAVDAIGSYDTVINSGTLNGALNFYGTETLIIKPGSDITGNIVEYGSSLAIEAVGFDTADSAGVSITSAPYSVVTSPGYMAYGNYYPPRTTSYNGTAVATISNAQGAPLYTFNIEFADAGAVLTADVTCFCAGTRILTMVGETPVEEIRPGDVLVTAGPAGAGTGRVIWVGRRRIDLSRHATPDLVRPVRIRAGAVAPGVPERDLRVSPHHGIYIDGALFEAISLVNGVTIFQERETAAVTYYHVELEAHGIILSEGCASESYLETGLRHMLDPRMAHLHAGLPRSGAGRPCVPVILSGPALDAARRAIAARLPVHAA